MVTWSLRKPSISTRVLHHIRTNKMFYRLSIWVALVTLFVGKLGFSWIGALLFTFLIYLVTGGWRFVRLFCLTFPRDIRGLFLSIKLKRKLNRIIKRNMTVADVFQEVVQKYSSNIAVRFEDKQWTFQEVDFFANKVANYFQSLGYKKGDVVALLMENRPELVFFWLGLSKIGVVSSLVNYNLKEKSLSHCISIVNAKGLIYSSDPDIAGAVVDIYPSIKDVELFQFGAGSSNGLGAQNLLEKLEEFPVNPPNQIHEKNIEDILFYIYTSGTTGLPKASIIKHRRFLKFGMGFNSIHNVGPNDVNYCTLPLYHTSGGILGAAALLFGATLVVRHKFSASQFWDECIHYKATYTMYIGELCRYLLAQPLKESEKKHTLRFASGNGLRPQIWDEFKSRFNIPLLAEFYGSTEGIVSLMNLCGHPGAVGFLPVTFPDAYPIRILKLDSSGEELFRGPDGLCVPCKAGETGQIAAKISQKPSFRFDGYVSKQATEKKIAHDVLKRGDKWFVSGDALMHDELGNVFFRDRLGDTFRWRGENVSTAEVEALISNVIGLNSVVVYGVEVPGCEGRAGMAAIEDPDDVVDVAFLGKRLPEILPPYARPIFLRIANFVATTGTFKFQKMKLRKEAFDLSVVTDTLFYLDVKSGDYRAFTKEISRKFEDGEMRF